MKWLFVLQLSNNLRRLASTFGHPTKVWVGANLLCMFVCLLIPDSSGFKHCTESFLFSLVNPSGAEPTKLSQLKSIFNQGENAGIYCSKEYGSTFGNKPTNLQEKNQGWFSIIVKDHDLHIASNANVNWKSYSELGINYECPPDVSPITFLTGDNNFVVHELEVFVYQE